MGMLFLNSLPKFFGHGRYRSGVQDRTSARTPNRGGISPNSVIWRGEEFPVQASGLAQQRTKDIALTLVSMEASHQIDKILERGRGFAGENRGECPLARGLNFRFSRHVEVLRQARFEREGAGDAGEKTVNRPHAEASDFPRQVAQ